MYFNLNLQNEKKSPWRGIEPGLLCDRQGYSPLYYQGYLKGMSKIALKYGSSKDCRMCTNCYGNSHRNPNPSSQNAKRKNSNLWRVYGSP